MRWKGMIIILMICLFLFGAVFTILPVIRGAVQDRAVAEGTAQFEQTLQTVWTQETEENRESKFILPAMEYGPEFYPEEELPHAELYLAMQEYNRKIYEDGQAELTDRTAFEIPVLRLQDYGIESDVIATIYIPKIEEELPVYPGATDKNMAKGAAQMSQTSLPIGGENTNCVIAAHRGYATSAFFRYLDRLEDGDRVYITNFWGTMTYEVRETKVIYPRDIEQILIQEGKDMVTLLTCHPYRSGGKYRLAVYCERLFEMN